MVRLDEILNPSFQGMPEIKLRRGVPEIKP